MFDQVEIKVKAGSGGNGIVSFRREKFVPFGGPDGGDGGDGGDVIIRADASIDTLRIFRQKRFYAAGNGRDGEGKKKHGKKGRDLVVPVPVGTVVSHKAQIGGDMVITDLAEPGQFVVVAVGGKGGLGNAHFASATNQAPRIAQKGAAGEAASLILELRIIADVGIIGYPNTGKSTLLAAASAAKPKIASYPFTTREPILGAVELGSRLFVLAEIPGLIDGAHLGRGLGHDFLRHIERTRMLIHLVDGSSASPLENMIKVNTELSLYDSALAQKPQLVAVNKIDLPEVRARLAEMKEAFSQAGINVLFISAATGEGVAELMTDTGQMLVQIIPPRRGEGEKPPLKVFRPQPRDKGISVRKEGDVFVVVAPELERIIAAAATESPDVRQQISRQIARREVRQALEKAGIKTGDKARLGNLEWEWA
ncbi:MAG: GTPase ObgE [Dehalococcoidia bacterium]|nr:MAG: GTPase ObgE [Dehalococcoidia bacterium]